MKHISGLAALAVVSLAIPLTFLIVASGAAPPVIKPANATATFLGSDEQWAQCRITLNDVQGLWGGTAVVVDGSGNCIVRIVDSHMQEKRFTLTLTTAETKALRKMLIDVDFLTVRIKERTGVPDEAKPAIVLRNSAGKEQSLEKWEDDHVKGFDKVYNALLDLKKKTKAVKPEYSGPYQPDWKAPATPAPAATTTRAAPGSIFLTAPDTRKTLPDGPVAQFKRT